MAEDNHSSGKEYLVSIMFSHYDQNNNGALEREELEQVCSQAANTINLQNYAVDTVKIYCLVGRCSLEFVTLISWERGRRVRIHCRSVLTFAPEGGKWSVSCPGHSTCRERGPSIYEIGGLLGPSIY